MSRSYKKNPVISRGSDKENKVKTHKKFRAKSKEKIKKINENETGIADIEIFPDKMHEVSDHYYDFKDKSWKEDATERELRK